MIYLFAYLIFLAVILAWNWSRCDHSSSPVTVPQSSPDSLAGYERDRDGVSLKEGQ